jgi:hypothetical protein
MVMLDGAKEKPIEPYALAKAALTRVRHMFWVAATLKKAGFLELSEDELRGYLYEIKAKAEDEETLERWTQAGREAFARGEVSVIDYSPYRYGDDLTHTKRLGNKFKDLLARAEISLFLKDFPDGWTEDNVFGYSRTEEEKRQEALKIVEELWNEQLERGDTEADDLHMRGGPVNAPPPDPRVISFASLVLRPSGSSFFCFH